MASLKSRSTDYFPNRTMAPSIRQLQEALYTHLDDLEKNVFIEALSSYGRSRDVFELVNALKKVLNTPAKRELFPLVKRVIKHEDVDAFDLLTRDEKQHSTLPRPYLYRPHIADLTVLNKSRAMSAGNRTPSQAGTAKSEAQRSSTSTQHRSRARSKSVERSEKHKTLSRSSSKSNILGEILEIDVGEPDGDDGGYGFTFRGGADIGVGIYVSSVDNGSNAQVRGLTVGDLIVEANNISFADVTHDEAARIIKAATRLHLTVSRVGRVPGKLTVLETFTWTDPKGRPVSPPLPGSGLAAGEDDGRRKSATLMLKGSDERKVNIVVQKGQGLGIMVRGGKEYGLGIFISGIDPFSVAENAGLKLGDQILDVNGRSFLDICHSEAVKQLKKRRHLMMTVRDVGKIPFSKTTIDETGWIESTKVESYEKSSSSRRSADGSVTDLDTQKKTTFLKGLGAMLSMSLPNSGHYKGQFHEQVRLLLNESEQASLSYYMAEYDKRAVSVQGLVQALFELLNTMAKFTLMSEIRLMIRSNDLAIFDELLAKRQIDQSLNEARKLLTNDVMSIGSYDSHDALKDDVHKRTLFSQQRPASGGQQAMESIHHSNKFQDSPHSFQLKSDSIRRLSTSTPNFTEVEKQIASKSRSRSRSPNSAHHVMKEMSPRITKRKQSREDNVSIVGKLDDPSDDSGVEINGLIFNGQTSSQHFQSSVYQPRRQGGHKHRSSTLEKITNHLNYSKKTYPVIENGPMPKQQTSNMKASKSANELNIKKKDHFRVIEHVAEVHSTRSETETRQREIHSHQSYSRLASDEKADANKGSQINISPITVIVEHARDKETEINNRQYTRVDKLHAEQHVQEAPSESQSSKKDVSLKTQFEGASSIRPGNQAENKVSQILPASHSVRFRNTDSYITINGNPGPPPQRHQTIIQNTFSLSAPPPPPPPPSPPSSAREERINSLKVDIEGRSKSKSSKPSVTPRMSSHAQRSTQHVLDTSIVSPANHKQPSVEDPANQPKKQRLFSSPAKTGSKKLSSQANKHSTTISVPFIKIKSDNSPLVAASLSRRDVTSASNDFVPISNDKEFSSEGHRQFSTFHVNSRNTKSPTNGSSAGSSMVETYKNVTRITVGKSSTTRTNLPVEIIKEKAAERYGDIPLEVVYIYRSKPTLGVAIEGGANTRQPLPKVINVQPGGSAYESGGLRVGHVILEVNGQPAVGLSHSDTAWLIAEAFKNKDNDRMELLVTEWSDTLLDTITVDVGLLQV